MSSKKISTNREEALSSISINQGAIKCCVYVQFDGWDIGSCILLELYVKNYLLERRNFGDDEGARKR